MGPALPLAIRLAISCDCEHNARAHAKAARCLTNRDLTVTNRCDTPQSCKGSSMPYKSRPKWRAADGANPAATKRQLDASQIETLLGPCRHAKAGRFTLRVRRSMYIVRV